MSINRSISDEGKNNRIEKYENTYRYKNNNKKKIGWIEPVSTCPFQTIVLWKDRFPWSRKLSYRLRVLHRPLIGALRLYLSSGKTLLLDSGNIYDSRLAGGRFGPFCFSQNNVMWAQLQYKCNGSLVLVDVKSRDVIDVECNMVDVSIWMWLENVIWSVLKSMNMNININVVICA